MKQKVKKMRNSKAFTLIELIVVIAVLGILVLIGAPKMLGYTAEAKLTQIKNDIKTYETSVTAKLAKNPELADTWANVPTDEVNKYKDDKKLIDTKGVIDYELKGEFIDIPESDLDIKSDLKGDFIMDSNGKVYYYDSNLNIPNNNGVGNTGGNTTPPVQPEDPNGDNDLDGFTNAQEDAAGTDKNDPNSKPTPPEDPNGDNDGDGFTNAEEDAAGTDKNDPNSKPSGSVYVADASDFTFLSDSRMSGAFTDPFGSGNLGILRYSGPTDIEVLELPNQVNGTTITSWAYLFPNAMPNLKKVISNNKNVVSTQNMFQAIKVDSLDLTELDVSGVKTMNSMFTGATLGSLDVTGWDTSNVTDMSNMFTRTTITNGFDLSSFDTSNVLDFYYTFAYVKTDSLDLTSFRINNNASLATMFTNAEINTLDLSSFKLAGTNADATRIFYMGKFKDVYAGTQADANILNTLNYESPWGASKPDDFTVTVK